MAVLSQSGTRGGGRNGLALNGGRLRHRASGRETVIHLGDLVRFRDRQIVEFVEFFDSGGLFDWTEGHGIPASTYMNAGNKVTHGDAALLREGKTAVANAIAAYEKLDPGPFLDLFADDVTYNSAASLGDFRFAGPFHGKEECTRNLRRIAEDYALEKYDHIRSLAQGDLIAVHADVAFRHRATDRLVTTEKIDLFRMRDGRTVEFNEFFDSLGARRIHQAP